MAQLIPQAVSHFSKPWQLMVSVCLTRMNKVTRELTDLEKRYAKLQDELEFEESVYSDHEHTKKGLQVLVEEKDIFISDEREEQARVAAFKLSEIEDDEEDWGKDLSEIIVAPRKTKSDELGNYNVLNRKLDDILHCVVADENLLLEKTTLYPYTFIEEGETLRSASERLLSSYKLNDNAIFFSNAPVGVLKLRFEDKEERGALYQGAKVFFMKARLHKCVKEPIDDVEWLTLKELSERTKEGYFRRVETFVC